MSFLNAVTPRFVHTRSRRRRARGFAAVANQNAQLAQQLGAENKQLKQQLQFMKLALLTRPYAGHARGLGHLHHGRLSQSFAGRFLGHPQSLLTPSVLGASGAITALGGRAGLVSASRSFGASAAFSSYGDARFNVFNTISFNHARFL